MAVYPLYVTLGAGDDVQDISPADTVVVTVDASFGTTGTWVSLTPSGCALSASSGTDGSNVTITPAVGASNYSVTLRTRDTEFGVWQSSTISGTISAPPPPPPPPPPPTSPTYSVSNVSTNEGASATASVTTTNVAPGTVLYWTVTAPSSDVSVTSGSFTISGNAGSFSIPAIADAATEGLEVYTINVRIGSTSGTVVASATLTINDTSTAPPPPPSTTYNITFYDPSFSGPRTNFNEGEFIYGYLSTTASNGTYYWNTSRASDLVSPVDGSFIVDGGGGIFSFTIAADSATEGAETLTLYIRSGSVSGAVLASATLTINDTSTAPVTDTTPNAFAFTDQSNVALSSPITSNTITVSGINAPASISVSGGTYSINGGAYTSASGTVTNGQTVTVRHTSSAVNSTATNTTLTIGGVSDVFTSTTQAPASDTTPDAFSFTDQSNVALSSTITSNAITVSGINAPATISVSGGTYSINGGAYTVTSGAVTNGQTVTVRHTSSSANSTAINTTLTIGGVSDTFTSTTLPPPAATYSVSNVSTNEGASATASVNTTNVAPGTVLYWTVTAPPSDVSLTGGSFTISANAGSFTIAAIADAATEGTEVYTINVRTGSTSGTIVASATLTINDTSTAPAPTDSTPNAFAFTDQSNVALSSTITSNAITVSGIDTAAYISISGGTYSINGGPYTSASGTVTNGQTVSVRHTSSSANSAVTNTTLTIGGVSDTFTSTTTAVPVGSLTAGLQTFYENGDIALDVTDRTSRLKDIVSVAANTTSSITVIKEAGELVFAFLLTDGATTYGSCFVNQSTGVVTYGLSGPAGGLLYYGVF